MATLPQLIEEDVSELERALQELLVKCDAGAALIIDKGGFLITQCGEYREFDTTTIAALSAASFAATQSIASLVSEANFTSVYQQEARRRDPGSGLDLSEMNLADPAPLFRKKSA